jgi:phosphomannomutase
MPELSRFYGIIIRMYFADHAPPHFHALYGDEEVVIDIRQLAIVRGSFSPRAFVLLMEWASIHQSDLLAAWDQAFKAQPPMKIPPLP